MEFGEVREGEGGESWRYDGVGGGGEGDEEGLDGDGERVTLDELEIGEVEGF